MNKVAVIASILLGGLLISCQKPPKALSAKSVLDQAPPEFVVEKWLTQEPDPKGKFVLIDFWATWCPPCRATIPKLNAFQQKYADKLVVIGVSNETEKDVRAMAAPEIKYANAIDTQARMSNALKVEGIPHVIIVDPKGIVRWEGFPLESGYELTDTVLEDLFAKYGK